MSENPDVEQLIQNLSSEDQNVQFATVKALGRLKDARAVDPLVKMLRIYDGETRYHAFRGQNYEPLEWELMIQREIINTLSEIGDTRAVESLIPALQDIALYEYAAEALGKIGGKQAIDALINMLRGIGMAKWWDEWGEYPEAGSKGLKLAGKIAVEPLLTTLRDTEDSHGWFHGQVISALGEIGDPSAIEPVLKKLSEAKTFHYHAVRGLGKFKDIRVIQPLFNGLRSKKSIWEHAGKAIAQIGEQTVEILIEALRDENVSVKLTAAYALGLIKDVRAVEPLIEALKDDSKETYYHVYRIAGEALGKIGDARAVAPLVEIGAWKALGEIGDTGAVDLILARLEQEYIVHYELIDTLRKLGDKRASDYFYKVMQDENNDISNRRIARSALADFKDERAIHFLGWKGTFTQ